jgi:hypothetical protein
MRRLQLTLVLIVSSLGMAHAAESNVAVVGGLDFGFKKLRLDTGSGGNVFNPSFVTINPSIVLGYRSFYASLSYDKSVSADPDIGQGAGGTVVSVTDYSRTDSTFTLGYRLNQSFSLFAGYTEGANKFVTAVVGGGFIVTDYTEKGPFAGVAYTKTFGDKGSLGMSIGYAKLDGDLKTDISTVGVFPNKGDTTGLSYGLSWSGPLTGSLSYRVGLKATQYEMKDPIDLTERYINFFFGIVNYF